MGNNGDIEYTLDRNKLSVKIVGDLLAELKECDGYREREALLYDNAYEPFYTYQTADQFGANLSEAPCFLEELDVRSSGDCLAVGKWYYFDLYMVEDFTATLAMGETVVFTEIQDRE